MENEFRGRHISINRDLTLSLDEESQESGRGERRALPDIMTRGGERKVSDITRPFSRGADNDVSISPPAELQNQLNLRRISCPSSPSHNKDSRIRSLKTRKFKKEYKQDKTVEDLLKDIAGVAALCEDRHGMVRCEIGNPRASLPHTKEEKTLKEEQKSFLERIQEILQLFLAKRASHQSLVDKGILKKGNVFGNSLQDQNCVDGIPEFLKVAIHIFEEKPNFLNTPHIYRQPGNLATIQSIRFQIEGGEWAGLTSLVNVHNLTGTIKLFFRELNEPLLPWTMSKAIEEKAKTKEVFSSYFEILSSMFLDKCQRKTLEYLLIHLQDVLKAGSENKQDENAISIVLGPAVSWPDSSAPAQYLDNINTQKITLRTMIDNTEEIIKK